MIKEKIARRRAHIEAIKPNKQRTRRLVLIFALAIGIAGLIVSFFQDRALEASRPTWENNINSPAAPISPNQKKEAPLEEKAKAPAPDFHLALTGSLFSPKSQEEWRKIRRILQQKEYAKAIPILERLVAQYPQKYVIQRALAHAYAKVQQYQKALHLLNDMPDTNPKLARDQDLSLALLVKQTPWKDLLAVYQGAVQVHPYIWARVVMGALRSQNRDLFANTQRNMPPRMANYPCVRLFVEGQISRLKKPQSPNAKNQPPAFQILHTAYKKGKCRPATLHFFLG